jgi:hypothetical protein
VLKSGNARRSAYLLYLCCIPNVVNRPEDVQHLAFQIPSNFLPGKQPVHFLGPRSASRAFLCIGPPTSAVRIMICPGLRSMPYHLLQTSSAPEPACASSPSGPCSSSDGACVLAGNRVQRLIFLNTSSWDMLDTINAFEQRGSARCHVKHLYFTPARGHALDP